MNRYLKALLITTCLTTFSAHYAMDPTKPKKKSHKNTKAKAKRILLLVSIKNEKVFYLLKDFIESEKKNEEWKNWLEINTEKNKINIRNKHKRLKKQKKDGDFLSLCGIVHNIKKSGNNTTIELPEIPYLELCILIADEKQNINSLVATFESSPLCAYLAVGKKKIQTFTEKRQNVALMLKNCGL